MKRLLLIGYGSPLRGDDAIGRRVADALAGDAGFTRVRQCHQLTPELAADLSTVDAVLFVDASRELALAAVSCREIGADEVEASRLTHACTPASLLALSAALYGKAPRAFAVGVGVASTDPGEGLSPALAAALPRVIGRVRRLAREVGRGAPRERR